MAGTTKSEVIPCGHGSVDNCTTHLHVRETLLCGKLKREVIRMKYPGSSGVDVVIVPPSPRQSPPPAEAALLPKVKYPPLDLDIVPGGDALFECVVADNTDTSVSWSKNKSFLLNSGRYKMWSVDRSFFFKISNVTEADESLYEYVVRNKHGEVTGDIQLLVNEETEEEDDDDEEEENDDKEEEVISRKTNEFDVTDKPVFLRSLKHEYVVIEGHPLELIVETEGEPEVSWFYEGHKLKTTGNEFITIVSDKNTHSLIIGETVPEDEGFYECVAVYEGNIEISTSTEIFVETNPTESTSDLDFDMDVVHGSEESNCHSDASSNEAVIVSCFGISNKGKSDMNQIENRAKQLPVYVVSETCVDSTLPLMLPVKEGDRVEVLTTKHGDTWLVRDAQAKSRIGFVSPTILVAETKGTG